MLPALSLFRNSMAVNKELSVFYVEKKMVEAH